MQISHRLLKIIQQIFVYGLSIVFNILIRAIRPIIHIRFGLLQSSRIGGIVYQAEIYLSKSCCKKNNRNMDMFFLESQICNSYLLEKY